MNKTYSTLHSRYGHHIKNTDSHFIDAAFLLTKKTSPPSPGKWHTTGLSCCKEGPHKTRAFIQTCLAFLIINGVFMRSKNKVSNSKLLNPRGAVVTWGPSLKLSVFIYINRQFIFRTPPAKPKHPHRAAFWRAKGLKPMGRHQFNHNQAS